MKNPAKTIALLIYYVIARRFPTQPVPGWRMGCGLRRKLVERIFASCGQGVIIRLDAYFGKGTGISIGDNSQIGERSTLGAYTTI